MGADKSAGACDERMKGFFHSSPTRGWVMDIFMCHSILLNYIITEPDSKTNRANGFQLIICPSPAIEKEWGMF
jgi:hypothetical protein